MVLRSSLHLFRLVLGIWIFVLIWEGSSQREVKSFLGSPSQKSQETWFWFFYLRECGLLAIDSPLDFNSFHCPNSPVVTKSGPVRCLAFANPDNRCCVNGARAFSSVVGRDAVWRLFISKPINGRFIRSGYRLGLVRKRKSDFKKLNVIGRLGLRPKFGAVEKNHVQIMYRFHKKQNKVQTKNGLNLIFIGFDDSDADGTRTRNHWIDSPVL